MAKVSINFVTQNRHKVEEVRRILAPFSIDVVQVKMEYDEPHDLSIHEVARRAARKVADELDKPIVLEDTGIFFEAYNSFPGALPKAVFSGIGYDGIMRLLAGKGREAYFMTVAAYCEPEKEPVLFEGKLHGTIAEEVRNPKADMMPYDMIFIPDGDSRTISQMKQEEKNYISQRAQAFTKLGKFLKSRSVDA